MIDYYVFDDGHGFMYKIGIEGAESQNLLSAWKEKGTIRSFKFLTTKPIDDYCKGKRKIGEWVIRFCQYSYMLKTIRG